MLPSLTAQSALRPLAAGLLLAALAAAGQETDYAAKVLALTGGKRTKMVWVRAEKSFMHGGRGPLMLFDSNNGQLQTLPAKGTWPAITADGKTLVFGVLQTAADDEKHPGMVIHTLDLDARARVEPKPVCRAKGILGLWRDPAAGRDWVIIATRLEPDGRYAGIVRCRLDQPRETVAVWDKSPGDIPVTLSADGRFAGSQFPWPDVSLISLPAGNRFVTKHGGCNGCVAPDNSYRLIHVDVLHKGVYVYNHLFEGSPEASAMVQLGHFVKRARYSNHPRALTFYGYSHVTRKNRQDVSFAWFNDKYDGVDGIVNFQTAHNDVLPFAWVDTAGCKDFQYPLGQFVGEAPFAVELQSKQITADAAWDFGDGTTLKGPVGKHSFGKAGTYLVQATVENRVLTGRVVVRPAAPPKVRRAELLGSALVRVTFSERIRAPKGRVSLKSGKRIRSYRIGLDETSLFVDLDQPLDDGDELILNGFTDQAQHANPVPPRVQIIKPAWPVQTRDILIAWSPAINFQLDPASKRHVPIPIKHRELTRVMDRFGNIRTPGATMHYGSSYWSDKSREAAMTGLRQTNELSFELVLQPGARKLKSWGRPCSVAAMASENNWSFWIGQINDRIVGRISLGDPAPEEANAPLIEIGRISDPAELYHVVVAYKPGAMTCFVNGKQTLATSNFKAALSRGFGRRQQLRFGCFLPDGYPPWYGRLHAFAWYRKALTAAEVAATHAGFQKQAAAHPRPRETVVQARLLDQTPVPKPQEIAPYEHCIVVNEYAVLRVLAGKLEEKRIRVGEWGLRYRRPAAGRAGRIGKIYVLRLEPFAANKAMQRQRRLNKLYEDPDVPVFFRVDQDIYIPNYVSW